MLASQRLQVLKTYRAAASASNSNHPFFYEGYPAVQAALNGGANAGLINAINNNTNAQIAALQANTNAQIAALQANNNAQIAALQATVTTLANTLTAHIVQNTNVSAALANRQLAGVRLSCLHAQ
jgi:hypothetical protein